MTSEVGTDDAAKSAQALRSLATSIIDAYQVRVRTISGMMKEAYDLIQSYQQDVGEALAALRDNMAKGQSLRHCDFDKIISALNETRARRRQQVSEQLDAFAAEEEQMIRRLRRIVAHGKASDLADLRKIQEDILTRQKTRERQVIGALRRFEIEQHELRTSLRWLLDKGQKATVAHLRSVVKALITRWAAKEREIFDVIEHLEKVRSRVRARWQQVVDASA
ncbi:MAG: hypothetical protein KAX19_09385 [Candidatus Brocadiae bacterium]|nr:hypothetical protein [Candidatus Brocadiia bacterium]